jgi:hypothetical protein
MLAPPILEDRCDLLAEEAFFRVLEDLGKGAVAGELLINVVSSRVAVETKVLEGGGRTVLA